MTTDEYVFEGQQDAAELRRLQVIEREYDVHSQARLSALGLTAGMCCLEAGVGAGSMARWMAETVGPEGRVVGVDFDDRYFSLLHDTKVELRHQDIRTLELPEATFDFIHARLFLEHLPEREQVLAEFVRWLKPGGWAVISDCDYSFDWRVSSPAGELWTRVQAITVETMASRSIDFTLGAKLPAMLRRCGLVSVAAHAVSPVLAEGGSAAELLQLSLDAQRQVLDLGGLSEADLDDLREQLPSGSVVGVGYTGVFAWGQRP